MTLKKILAGTTLAVSLALGSVGVAHAAEGERAKPNAEQVCSRVQDKWQKLTALDQRIHEHYKKLQEARQRAEAAGKTEIVAKIDERLAKLREHHARLEAKMKEIRDKVAGRCELTGGESSPL